MKKDLSRLEGRVRQEKNQVDLQEYKKDKQVWRSSEQMLRSMVFKLSLLSKVDESLFINKLAALRKSLNDGLPTPTLKSLFDDIFEGIRKLQVPDEAVATQVDPAHELNRQSLSSRLLKMIGGVPFPHAILQRLEPLMVLLRSDVDKNTNSNFLRSLDAYFGVQDDFYHTINDEQEKMRAYLHGLTNQLLAINEDIQMTERLQQDSALAGTEIHKVVNAAVSKLENTMSSEANVKNLKTDIQKSIKMIRGCMTDQREKEEQWHSQSTAMINKLNLRLQKMEDEANHLRAQMVEKDKQYLSDSLTGIANRKAYDDRIRQECERHVRNNTPVCMMICDVDKFKNINDTYGHATGDMVLRGIAEVLRKNIRLTDFVARYGGEEFTVIMPCTVLKEGYIVAEMLRCAIEQFNFDVKNKKLPVTISGGVTQFRENDSPTSLFERADTALYVAKESGRNRVETD